MTHLILALVFSGLVFERPTGLPRSLEAPAGQTPSHVHFPIRVYQQDEYNPTLVGDLQRSLTRVLEGSGLGLTLVDCFRQDRCREDRAGHELVLRLLPGHHPNNARVCGIAYPGGAGEDGVLMTIFGGCVSETTKRMRAMAVRREADFSLRRLSEIDVLAPIVVHEAVHLLLPDENHGFGLWKRALDQGDLERSVRGRLKLGPALAARVRAAVSARYAVQKARR